MGSDTLLSHANNWDQSKIKLEPRYTDPVATGIGCNFGQPNQYNDPNSPSYLQGATPGNVTQSLLEVYSLFTTSNSAHSTYRWNDPATWTTNVVAPVTPPINQISTGSQL